MHPSHDWSRNRSIRKAFLFALLGIALVAAAAAAAPAPPPYKLQVQPPGKYRLTATISCFKLKSSSRYLARRGGTLRVDQRSFDWESFQDINPDLVGANSSWVRGNNVCLGDVAMVVSADASSKGQTFSTSTVKTYQARPKKPGTWITVEARFLSFGGGAWFEHGVPTKDDLDGGITDYYLAGVPTGKKPAALCASLRFGSLSAWPSSAPGGWFSKNHPKLSGAYVMGATVDLHCGVKSARAAAVGKLIGYASAAPAMPRSSAPTLEVQASVYSGSHATVCAILRFPKQTGATSAYGYAEGGSARLQRTESFSPGSTSGVILFSVASGFTYNVTVDILDKRLRGSISTPEGTRATHPLCPR